MIGRVDKRRIDCELVGGPFDGQRLELAGRPPQSHLDIPASGIPDSHESLFEKIAADTDLLRYVLDWWDGSGMAKYRYDQVRQRGWPQP